jgi:hypothetical protein
LRGIKRVLFIAALLLSLPAHAQETVSYFGFDFPLRIGVLTRGEVTNYEKDMPGLGYGIDYDAPGQRVSIHVYTARKRQIDSDINSVDQKTEFANLYTELQDAKTRGIFLNLIEGEQFESPAVKNPFFRCGAFIIDHGAGRVSDRVVCLGGRNNKFVHVAIWFGLKTPGVALRTDAVLREVGRALNF